jgi:hypothetical protein
MKTLLALTIIAAMAGSAHAEKWRCLYKGTWTEDSTGGTSKMDWLLDWTAKGDHWELVGDLNDRLGHSWFDGTCDDSFCTLVQTYKSGKAKGKKYYFSGSYQDEQLDEGHTRNRFHGTWGYSKASNTDGGKWDAIATCEKQDD